MPAMRISSTLFSLKSFSGCILIFCFTLYSARSQEHVAPKNGGDGIPGEITGSFKLIWASVSAADNYEYILSDNPLCFVGCPGDTRQRQVGDTIATEYNLQEDRWYYWITRYYTDDSIISSWTTITSFLAKTPELSERIIQVSPNPIENNTLRILIDWAVNPSGREIQIEVYNLSGQHILRSKAVKTNGNTRFQTIELDLGVGKKGLYLAIFTVDDNPNNPNNLILHKFIIP